MLLRQVHKYLRGRKQYLRVSQMLQIPAACMVDGHVADRNIADTTRFSSNAAKAIPKDISNASSTSFRQRDVFICVCICYLDLGRLTWRSCSVLASLVLCCWVRAEIWRIRSVLS